MSYLIAVLIFQSENTQLHTIELKLILWRTMGVLQYTT